MTLPDTHIHCAVHGAQKRAHPFYHDKNIHCAECATEHERRESARRQQPDQYSRWLVEIANFLAEHNDWFTCDCEASQESDTGAWIHQEAKCASYWEDHIDIVLREAAERIALDAETIAALHSRLAEGEALLSQGVEIYDRQKAEIAQLQTENVRLMKIILEAREQ